jgi:hypothetical protein
MSLPTRRVVRASGILLLLLSVWRPDAGAEPIQITGGSLELSGPSGPNRSVSSLAGPVSLVGLTRGFTLTAYVSTHEGIFQPWAQCQFAPVCIPGAAIDLRAYWVGLGVVATVTLDGLTFLNVGSLSSDDSAVIEFIGSRLAPDFGTGTASLVVPFQFEGRFTRALGGGATLLGQGMATLFLAQSWGPTESAPAAWRVVGARYAFSPTPEPGTLVLTASGIAAVLLRRRRGSMDNTAS